MHVRHRWRMMGYSTWPSCQWEERTMRFLSTVIRMYKPMLNRRSVSVFPKYWWHLKAQWIYEMHRHSLPYCLAHLPSSLALFKRFNLKFTSLHSFRYTHWTCQHFYNTCEVLTSLVLFFSFSRRKRTLITYDQLSSHGLWVISHG